MIKSRVPSFKGVFPSGNKITADSPIESLPVYNGDIFTIPLTQHIGKPAVPIVNKGDIVKAGQIIATADGNISANIHSSVDGIVSDLNTTYYPVSGSTKCITITAQDQTGNIEKLSNLSFMDTIKEAGIVGMGGAMFPTSVKFQAAGKLHTLIVNGAECEPYLTCDHRLLLEKATDLIKGADLIKKELGLKKVYIAIENNKSNAIKLLKELKCEHDIVSLPVKYPQGGEKQLILSVLGKEVPENELPSKIGVLVQNISTVLAVYNAWENKIPLIKRVVTVTKDVNEPKNILAPIGTPISRLIHFCKGHTNDFISKVILGGPMTGFSAHSLEIPVYKGMNGVIVFTSSDDNKKTIQEKNFHKKQMPCIRCGQCVEACPINLNPIMLENFYNKGMFDDLLNWKLLSCIECNSCNYICPSNRPLKTLFRLAKKKVAQLAIKVN